MLYFHTHFPILKKHFPTITNDQVVCFTNGHDHIVYVVNQKHVFRFPRSGDHGKQDEIISIFSQMFTPHSSLPIQKMTSHVDKKTKIKYQTYEFIKGVPLTKELAKSLSEEALLLIAKDMGKFLSVLHSFPIEKVNHLGIESLVSPQDYADYFVDVIDLDKPLIARLLTEDEWDWFVNNVEEFKTTSYVHPYKFTITHSDMLPEHILIDEKTLRLSGIIDFTLRIADPANDFKYFDRYGSRFLEEVYKNYKPVDEYFDRRRSFYASDLPIANLYQSVLRHDRDEIQKQYIQEVKDYVFSNS